MIFCAVLSSQRPKPSAERKLGGTIEGSKQTIDNKGSHPTEPSWSLVDHRSIRDRAEALAPHWLRRFFIRFGGPQGHGDSLTVATQYEFLRRGAA
jgi:hypothetical protein